MRNHKERFAATYKMSDDDLVPGRANVEETEISTEEDASPVFEGYLPKLTPKEEKETERELVAMEKMGVIERIVGATRWCSSIRPVVKPNGRVRICVNYKKLNDITIKDKYPLPNMDDILFHLKGKN